MCGRFILVQKLETLEKRFNLSDVTFQYTASYNTAPGMQSAVITNTHPRLMQGFRFGLCPFWAKKDMLLINASSEGDKNAENDTLYHGPKEIINKPAFRKPIRSRRCLVIADAFIEGSQAKGLDEAYIVYLRNKVRPFAMAGLWDEWSNPLTGQVIRSFAIITTIANPLMQKIGHHRSPVILEAWQERIWLDSEAPLSDITALLKPYDSEKMNAYRIGSNIKNPKNNHAGLLTPIGNTIYAESDIQIKESLYRQGFGNGKPNK